jgi:phage shock protein E
MSSKSFYLTTGGIALLYTAYSLLRLYSLGGEDLISPKDAKRLIRQGQIKQIVDVRTQFEYRIGHYPKSRNIPIGSINESNVRTLNKQQGVLVYCNTGQRARKASEMLRELGFKKVYYIDGTYQTLL